MKSSPEPLRLNIGSGDSLTLKGYTNIDAKFGDVAYPLKYEDGSAQEIRASHILEHFLHRQTLDVLKDWVRVLKPGGILKVAVPDFAIIAKSYVANGYHAIADGYVYGGQVDGYDFHHALFDDQKLRTLMEQAGLMDIQPWESEVRDCASLPVSLNLMGRKPQPVAVQNGHRSLYTLEDNPFDPRYEVFAKSIKAKNYFSQYGEDGAIEAIFEKIGIENKWCVECGAGDGLFFSNTRRLIENGWKSLQIEADQKFYEQLRKRYKDTPGVFTTKARIGLEDPCRLEGYLDTLQLPSDFDLLVLDIDGQEYHIINSMVKYRPRVLIVEFSPDADEMYIPEPNAPTLDQAGRLATKFAVEARGYDVICRTTCNLICVRRDIAHLLQEEAVEQLPVALNGASPRFIAGEWREEKDVVKDKVQINVAIAMSSPRIGYLDSADIITEIALAVQARRGRGFGVFFHHSLSRCIKQILDDDEADVDVIVTADYDTFARPADLIELIRLLYENPAYDAIIPVEIKRGKTDQVLIGTDGPIDWSQGLVPANAGHFGLTVFRRRVFERMKKPWFWEKPDANGDWGEGRIDADIGMWHNFCDSGFKAALATKVVIGHREEVVSVPKIIDGKVVKVYYSIDEWLQMREEEALNLSAAASPVPAGVG